MVYAGLVSPLCKVMTGTIHVPGSTPDLIRSQPLIFVLEFIINGIVTPSQ